MGEKESWWECEKRKWEGERENRRARRERECVRGWEGERGGGVTFQFSHYYQAIRLCCVWQVLKDFSPWMQNRDSNTPLPSHPFIPTPTPTIPPPLDHHHHPSSLPNLPSFPPNFISPPPIPRSFGDVSFVATSFNNPSPDPGVTTFS